MVKLNYAPNKKYNFLSATAFLIKRPTEQIINLEYETIKRMVGVSSWCNG